MRSNLAEVGLGAWEGELVANVKEQYASSFDNYRNDLDKFEGKEFGGEDIQKLKPGLFVLLKQPLIISQKAIF